MTLKPNKTCIICGNQYRYCVNCGSNKPYQYWRNIYCSEDCKGVGQLWYQYRGGEISQKDAKILIERYPTVVYKVNAIDTPVAKEIQAICSYVEEVEKQPVEDVTEESIDIIEPVEEVEDIVEPIVEEAVKEQPKKSTRTNYNKNKKNNKDQ